MKKLLVVVLVAGVAVGAWFGLHRRSHNAAIPPTTTTSAPTMPVRAYFYLGAALVPVVVDVPKTGAVATAATRALLAGPPTGYTTSLTAGTKLDQLTIASGTARANFSPRLAVATRAAQAQIVYTLTQFPTVTGVIVNAGGSPVPLSNGAETPISGPATRTDYRDLTQDAQIFVSAPLRDSTVTSPVKILGTASVFEGTLSLEVWKDGKRIATASITASQGAPGRGPFQDALNLAPGKYRLVFYEPSAADGSHLHTTTVEITVMS